MQVGSGCRAGKDRVKPGKWKKEHEYAGPGWHFREHVPHSTVEECVLATRVQRGGRASDGTQGRAVADSRTWCMEESLPRAW